MKPPKYLPAIGLEIHVQLKTKSKMFCACPNESWKIGREELKPNTAVCPVCTGQPGTLPVPNKEAVGMVIKTGLALNCKIAEHSKFDRKNYFYPDLPKGYQISQYDQPFCTAGSLTVNREKIGITRIHLEEDTGKNIHPKDEDCSLIDYNRSGIPLMEMVTEPDIHSARTAKEFCQSIQQILRSLGISDADMEKSQMRCEVNISLAQNTPARKIPLGTKVEIKNLNSFKTVERSIEYEIMRQTKALDAGEAIIQETRGWNENEQKTFSQRRKEGSADYRYFPEPDIPPFEITADRLKRLKDSLPELPAHKIERFCGEYGFIRADAAQIIANNQLADFTENIMSELRRWLVSLDEIELTDDEAWEKYKNKLSKLVANWLINKLGGALSAAGLSLDTAKLTAENFAELITLIYKSRVNSTQAQELLLEMVKDGGDPSNLLESRGHRLLEDVSDLEPLVDLIIKNNPAQVAKFKSGKPALLKFFIGQVMRETKGAANPKMAEEMLLQKLT